MNIFRQLMDSCTERAQEDAAYLLEELASCTHVQIYLLQGPRRDRMRLRRAATGSWGTSAW